MIPEFAHSLFQAFEREEIPLLLAGGWAVCAHGYSRLTLDVDWVCPRSKELEAIKLMDSLGFDKISEGMASRFKWRKDRSFPFVDLIWVNDESFGLMAVPDSAVHRNPGVPLINFRAMLAMKLYALKDRATRQDKDLIDIRSLLQYGSLKIPEDELKELCDRYAGSGAYDLVKMKL